MVEGKKSDEKNEIDEEDVIHNSIFLKAISVKKNL